MTDSARPPQPMHPVQPAKRIDSRDNSLIKLLRRLSGQSAAYRKLGQFWVEGEHLCSAARECGASVAIAVFADSFWSAQGAAWAECAPRLVVIPDALFDEISRLESAARVGFVIDLPAAPALQRGVASVVLDRVQDAGNVGSILRSAAAFGFRQVLSLTGSAALWSPKVLRAGMGAHFALDLVEGLATPDIQGLGVPLVVTSSHHGELLPQAVLPWPCAWVLGHEGQGICESLSQAAALSVRIGQPGGGESLNVAAAAAICLHASAAAHAKAAP